jgi:tetratricopeptide (TPR) repeat protein
MKPDHAEAYGLLGYLLYTREDWPAAVQALRRFLEFEPRHAFSHFVLAICFEKLGNVESALLHYNKFLEFDDGTSDPRSFQARQRARILEERLRK